MSEDKDKMMVGIGYLFDAVKYALRGDMITAQRSLDHAEAVLHRIISDNQKETDAK